VIADLKIFEGLLAVLVAGRSSGFCGKSFFTNLNESARRTTHHTVIRKCSGAGICPM
jgi:hypothetical protein